MRVPRLLQAYIFLTATGSAAWLAYLVSGVEWSASLVGETALFFILAVVSGSFPMPVAQRVNADVSTAVLFGAVLLLEPGAAALAAIAGIVTSTYLLRFGGSRLRLPWYKYPFNAGAMALYVGMASLVFHTLGAGSGLSTPAVIAAAAVMYVANTSLVTGVASLQIRINPIRFWWAGTRDGGAAELSLIAFGFLGAIAYRESPLTIAALVIPVALVHIAFSGLTRVNAQLQGAMHRLEALQGQIANHAKLASVGAVSLDIAHQVKNPLGVLLGRLEILQDRIPIESPDRAHVDIAMSAGSRLRELTQNFTSLGSQKPIQLNLPDLLNEAYGIAGLHSQKLVDCRWEYPDSLPKVLGNPVLLREALTNVFSNAMDAVREDGVVTASASQVNGHVMARISDNGSGIAKEIMGSLFEPFRSTKTTGLGLGLFAAKHIVEMHHGRLTVETEEGQGTSVTIMLPAHRPGHRDAEAALTITG